MVCLWNLFLSVRMCGCLVCRVILNVFLFVLVFELVRNICDFCGVCSSSSSCLVSVICIGFAKKLEMWLRVDSWVLIVPISVGCVWFSVLVVILLSRFRYWWLLMF